MPILKIKKDGKWVEVMPDAVAENTEAIGALNERVEDIEDNKANSADLAKVATSGKYSDLSGAPTIPTKTSQLMNDSGFKTTDNNTTYTLTKSGSQIVLTGSDGSETSVTDSVGEAGDVVEYGPAGTDFGLVKTGGDVNISGGVITVNDNSHHHSIENIDGLQSALDIKTNSSMASQFRRLKLASTYPRLIKWGEDLYLFLDNGYVVSKDNGVTFSEKVTICSAKMESEINATDKTTQYNSVANAMPIVHNGKLLVFYRANYTPAVGDTTSVRYASIRMREISADGAVSDPVIIKENAEIPLRNDANSKCGGYWEPFPFISNNGTLYLFYSDDTTKNGAQHIQVLNLSTGNQITAISGGKEDSDNPCRPGMPSVTNTKIDGYYYMTVENTDRIKIGTANKTSFIELYSSENGVNKWTSCGKMFFDIDATLTCAPYIYALSDGRVAISFQTNEKTVENVASTASKHHSQRAYVYISKESTGAPQDRTYEPVNEYNYASNEAGYWCSLYEVNGVLYSVFTNGFHDSSQAYKAYGNVIATSTAIPDVAEIIKNEKEVDLNLENGTGTKSLQQPDSNAYGAITTALGKGTIAVGINEVAIGQFNEPTVSTLSSSRVYRGEWDSIDYAVRDVVLYEGQYYVCKKKVVFDDSNIRFPTDTTYWTLISGESKSANIITVGNGSSDTERSNAFALDWNGHGWFAGGVTVGSDKKTLATIDEVQTMINDSIYGCLVEGTLIDMADGTSKPIEEIEPGELIKSYNPITKELTDAVVIDAYPTGKNRRYSAYNFTDGRSLVLFGYHQFYDDVTGTTVDIRKINNDHRLINIDKETDVKWAGTRYVLYHGLRKNRYNLISSNNLYFANGVLLGHKPFQKLEYVEDHSKSISDAIAKLWEQDCEDYNAVTASPADASVYLELKDVYEEYAEAENQIAIHKKKLADTDYKSIKRSENLIDDDEWEIIAADRQKWRDIVNENQVKFDEQRAKINAAWRKRRPAGWSDRSLFETCFERDNAAFELIKNYYVK